MDSAAEFSLTGLFSWDALTQSGHEDRIYYLLSLGIVVFFAMSAFFALLTLFLRYQNNRRDALWQSLHELWDNDILMVLSGDMSVADFQKRIPRKQELNFIKYLTPYAWRLAGSDLNILSALANPYLPRVLKQLKHHNPEIRAWAISALSHFGMPKHVSTVMPHLRDPSSVVAMSAANALLQQRKVYYIEPVLKYFHRFDQWNIASLTSLITNCGTHAIPVLERIYLDRSKTVRTRIVAAEALSQLNDFDIADKAAELLDTETDQEMIAASLRLLAVVGQTSHRDIVNKLCQSDNDVIRVNAMKTLRNISVAEDIPVFRHGLVDPSPWVAVQSARGLHELGDDEFLRALIAKGHSRARLAQQVLGEA